MIHSTRSRPSLVSRQMIFFKQRSAYLRSCSTSNGTRYLVAQFITKVRLVLRTCTGLLQNGPVLKTTARLDTFHQLLYPNTYFGWLSIVPRAGFRATYYDKTRDLGNTLFPTNEDPLIPNFIPDDPTPTNPVINAGSGVRTVVDAGVEASFKLSRSWDNVSDRTFGLDGLLHVIQPYTDFSYVHENGINPSSILQFDRFEPSTQLAPIDFPQFTSIDSIASWTIWRNGIRNRLETRRDDVTVTWLELDTFFDVNFDNPYDRRTYSNFFNRLRFTPLPWASLSVDSQIPAFSSGFTEVNT